MFEPRDPAPRVDVQVVARGDSARLRRCVDALVAHRSATAYSITCVINPVGAEDAPLTDLPPGVRVLSPAFNLGWGGGLHLARGATSAPYLVWAQEDMVVADGWLDALVATADAHPDAGAVGSVEVDPETREANGYAGGFALPPDDVGSWNITDVLRAGGRVDDLPLDWVTSKGMLTRADAFDAVGGTDPRLFPLNHVDKDYSSHLRVHGWRLYVAPGAHLFHERSRSAPGLLRRFLVDWQEPRFNARWGEVVARLDRGEARDEPHECATWAAADMPAIERLVGREASLLVVAVAGDAAARIAELTSASAAAAAEAEAKHDRVVADFRSSASWRLTAPLRAAGRLIGKAGRD